MYCVAWEARYKDEVLALLKDVPFKQLIWKWQFEENPYGRPFRPVVFVDDKNRVIGFNGVMPVMATEKGSPIDAIWSCDFYISPDCRGKGFGTKIKQELHQQADEIMAFGVSDRACEVLEHLGWERQRNVHTYRRILRPKSIRAWSLVFVQLLSRVSRIRRNGGSLNLSLQVSDRLPDATAVDDLWSRCEPHYEKVVSRTFAYLDWKYQKHPLARYAFVTALSEGLLLGLIVVRFERGTLRLVDYCGPVDDNETKKALIRHCLKHWSHAVRVTVTCSNAKMDEILKACGFLRIRSKPRFYVFKRTPVDSVHDKGWFLMGGDSDGEMLSASASSIHGGPVPKVIHETGKDPLCFPPH